MSAGTILQSLLDEVGLEETSPDIASTEFPISQIREFMEQAGEDIAKRAEWSGLYASDTISGSVSSHTLPSDFQEMGERGSVYLSKSEGTYTPLRAITDPGMWDFIKQHPSTQLYYMIRGGTLEFSDALDADGAKMTYVKNTWVNLDGGGDGTAIAANADTFHIPERLIRLGAVWRWYREKGHPYDDHVAEFEADLVQEIKANRGQG
jgi:hypothetical protein